MKNEKQNVSKTKKKQNTNNDFTLLFAGAANIQFTGSWEKLLGELKVAQEHYAIVSYDFTLRDGHTFGKDGIVIPNKTEQSSVDNCQSSPEKTDVQPRSGLDDFLKKTSTIISGQSDPSDRKIDRSALRYKIITPASIDRIARGNKTAKRAILTSFDTLADLNNFLINKGSSQNPFEYAEVIYNAMIIKQALRKKQISFDALLEHFRMIKKSNRKEKIVSFRIYLALNTIDYNKPYYEQFDLITKSTTKLMKKLNASKIKDNIKGHFWMALFNKFTRTENGCVGIHLNIYLNDTPTQHFVEDIGMLWQEICQGASIPISKHGTYRPDDFVRGDIGGYQPIPNRLSHTEKDTKDHRSAIVMLPSPSGKNKSIPYMLVQPEKKALFEKYLFDLARESFCPPFVTTFSTSSVVGYKKRQNEGDKAAEDTPIMPH
ncbi:hypothetical protein [Buttiauxella massiliensis]|uniref:hypothetical protein n=1 Tax=Buttiauxella massiliensis TaxID=2831590 RepID=UPI00125EAE7F|nr:hypothetical protein [Buttiauxella massiliensis]